MKLHTTHALQKFGTYPVVVEGKLKHRYVAGQAVLVDTPEVS